MSVTLYFRSNRSTNEQNTYFSSNISTNERRLQLFIYHEWVETLDFHLTTLRMSKASLYYYGSIANERTGNPDAFSGFGTILKMIAPLAGSLSKFVNNSIW